MVAVYEEMDRDAMERNDNGLVANGMQEKRAYAQPRFQ